MRIFFFPLPVTVAVDVAAWLLIQLGISKIMISIPKERFNPSAWLFRERKWERGGRMYETVFIKSWKDHLLACIRIPYSTHNMALISRWLASS